MAGIFKSRGSSSKHEKLADKWRDYRHNDNVSDGVTYLVKYLGSTLVTELTEEGQSYGDHISGEAVEVVVSMAKASNKKLTLMSVNVSPRGIQVINTETGAIYSDLDIYRICFCTADRVHGKVFAYIARNKDNETMECHAFLCPKRKIAEAISLTVAKSFKLAEEEEEKLLEQRKNERHHQHEIQAHMQQDRLTSSMLTTQTTTNPSAGTSSGSTAITLGFEDNFIDMKIAAGYSAGPGSTVSTGHHPVATSSSQSQDLLLL